MEIKKYNDFINENNSIDENNLYVKQLKNDLVFQYKIRKKKYIKVKEILGNIADDNLDLEIKLSNKDTIDVRFYNNELKISINDELIYDLDDITYDGIIKLIYKTYEKHLEQQGKKIIKKENPFKN